MSLPSGAMETPLSLGVCCMETKRMGKPMRAILERLRRSEDFELVEFEEALILDRPVERLDGPLSGSKSACSIHFRSIFDGFGQFFLRFLSLKGCSLKGWSPRDWPQVRCLIAFESKGFPLEKCIESLGGRLESPWKTAVKIHSKPLSSYENH